MVIQLIGVFRIFALFVCLFVCLFASYVDTGRGDMHVEGQGVRIPAESN